MKQSPINPVGERGRIAFAVAASIIVAGSAVAADLHVPSQFPTIQQAIDAAQPGDVVIIADGVYTGAGNRDLQPGGKAITIRSANGPEHCVIDAGGTSQVPYRGFIFDSGETHETVLDGLTISGGATPQGAVQDQFNGGGLFFRGASATVINCVIDGNACGCWGGGVYSTLGANPIFINCDISNNASNDDGGAVFVWNGGGATLINCTMIGNWARVTGGAVTDFDASGSVHIINCTMAANEAPFGSAVLGWTVEIVNSIIWDNIGGDPIYYEQTPVSYSIVEGGRAGVGNLDLDPQFVDPASGDYRVLPGSAAIDAGNSAAIPAGVAHDMIGNERVHDDPGMIDTGAGAQPHVDLGAYEFPGSSRMAATLVDAAVTTGAWIGGDVSDLAASDDQAFIVRSGSGVSLLEKHLMEFVATAVNPGHSRPTTLDVSVESRIDHPTGVMKLALFNLRTWSFEQVGSGPVGESDRTLSIADIDAEDYVSGDGSVYVSVKEVVFVPFLAFRFVSSTDLIEVMIE